MNRLNAMRAMFRYAEELWIVLMEGGLSEEDVIAVCHDRNRIMFELFAPYPDFGLLAKAPR